MLVFSHISDKLFYLRFNNVDFPKNVLLHCNLSMTYSPLDKIGHCSLNGTIVHVQSKMLCLFFRECPLALEAINGLLTLGQKGADVHSIVITSLPPGISQDW